MRSGLPYQLALAGVVCFFVLATPSTLFADSVDAIHLGLSPENVHFIGNGKGTNSVGLMLGSCYHKSGTCDMSGAALGPGAGKERYIITVTSPIMLMDEGNDNWATSMPGNISFCYGRNCDLLKGTLVLLQFKDSGQSGNFTFVFKATGGSLESMFTNTHGDFGLSLSSTAALLNPAALIGTNNRVSETFTGGFLTPVPEPASLALLGTGLLGIVGKLRHKSAL
jgi:PEP-CTERM motif